MATIKSYTDINKSKKLAEILPLESADMYFPWYIEDDGDTIESGHRISTPNIGNFITHRVNKMILPCWSLAALLNILPKNVNNETLFIETSAALWHIGYRNIYTARADNLVDACVAMVEKLYELNLL